VSLATTTARYTISSALSHITHGRREHARHIVFGRMMLWHCEHAVTLSERPLVAMWPRISIVCTRLSSVISAGVENFSFRLLSENNIS